MSTSTTPNKYGITVVKRTTKIRPKTIASLGDEDGPQILEAAKRVIAEHRDVIKALAKR